VDVSSARSAVQLSSSGADGLQLTPNKKSLNPNNVFPDQSLPGQSGDSESFHRPDKPVGSVPNDVVRTEQEEEGMSDQYFIFTTGDKTYAAHQLGIKRIHSSKTREWMAVLESENYDRQSNVRRTDPDYNMHVFDVADHIVEFEGHIIGMCMSPDNRYEDNEE